MHPQRIAGLFLIVLGIASLRADEVLHSLKGRCNIRASTFHSDNFELRLERSDCIDNKNCNDSETNEPLTAFTGLSLSDLNREGAHAEAVLQAGAGTLTCSGSIHNSQLVGDFTFEPNKAFVERMRALGITGLDSQKLEAYTLFHIEADWVQSLETAGVTGIDASNLIAMKIFHVDAGYVHSLNSLGYATPSAQKLIALKVQNVDTNEVKQVRALGYQPTLDELIQMRIFKVTPEFIQQMQDRGFKDLTISKLVQIKIFKLDE
jgi:hypothetical protein